MYAGWDFLLYAALLAVVVLWNLLTQVLRRRRRQSAEIEAGAPAPVEQVPEPWGRAGPAPGLREGRSLAESAPQASRARSPRRRSRFDVRRAMVDMAVLGPPRALQPWEADSERRAGR
ncbi:MAG TPA: hypothetical protein VEA40_25255 [Ramlibacter sp.]|nr:hypothetical protein [Ramlibacter sp.]